MRKDDLTIAKMMISKIKSRSMDYHEWTFTKFWNDWCDEQKAELLGQCEFELDEIPVLAIVINQTTWTIFSSRAVYYANDNMKAKLPAEEFESEEFKDFKGYKQKIGTMYIRLKSKVVHKVTCEAGKPSMAPIYAMHTLFNLR
jgi:hypothetical protein